MASSSKPARRSWFWAAFRAFFLMGVALAGLGVGLAAALISAYSSDLPDVNQLKEYQPSGTTRIVTANNELIATLYRENRTWLPLAKVPESLRKAIVASEDARFYSHVGVDPVGMARAVWLVLRNHSVSQGASTITMQLARGVFLNDERTVKRKVQEMLVAWQLERRFTKDQLLEFYLNQIYFGAGAYGVEAAAVTYFGKPASALDLAQSALIVGVVPAPSEYSPFVHPDLAKERQVLVLRRMVEVGAITQQQADAAKAEKLRFAKPRNDPFLLKYPYFTTWLLQSLVKEYGEDALYRGGLTITTTLDLKMQKAAQEAVLRGLSEAAGQHVGEAALVAIDPETGFVKAMVGGTGWSVKSQFNRAWQAERPAGSSFKIFVYGAALEAGFTPDTIVPDAPVTLHVGPSDDWTPKNSDGRFMGSIPLRTALRFSRNTVSARLVDALTPARVIDLAYKMGLRSHVEPVLSIALGSTSVTPFDMAAALAVIANGGRRLEPTGVMFIKDADKQIVVDNRRRAAEPAMNPIAALGLTEMMQGVIEGGTGYNARLDGRPAAGKTGTTDAHRDAWFVGFVPQLAAAVWVGNDDNSEMWGTFGGDVPAPIWRYFMQAALARQPVRYFGADANGTVTVRMCRETGRRATPLCSSTETQAYRHGEVPQAWCGVHVFVNKGTAVTSAATTGPVVPTPEGTPTTEAAVPAPTPSGEDEQTPEPQATEPAPPEPTPTAAETAPPPQPDEEPPAAPATAPQSTPAGPKPTPAQPKAPAAPTRPEPPMPTPD